MSSYRVDATIPVSVQVSSQEIVKILEQEKVKIHGGYNRYVQFGILYKDTEEESEVFIKELTYDELELERAVNRMIHYFYLKGSEL